MTEVEVYSKALDTTIHVQRIIGRIDGDQPGPTLIFMGGIHGNEPAGVFALKRMLKKLKESSVSIRGSILCITGNMGALQRNQRFIAEDMNRIWSQSRMSMLPDKVEDAVNEEMAEQIEVCHLIREVLSSNAGPFYFFDIHTTSSETLPFLTVNDSLLNRAYTAQYPLPIILGIEEYLNGPILSYINELGYVAFGFEAGQHDDLGSIAHAEAFAFLSLVFTGVLSTKDIDFQRHYDMLAKTTGDVRHTYEIHFRYLIKPEENFKMEPGFYNFQKIRKQQLVAISNGEEVRAKENGRIFLPLYQNQGTDGFFAIRRIKERFLRFSAWLRKYRFDRFLILLPGISWLDTDKSGLMINKTIARFLAKQLLHLLGYRSMEIGQKYIIAHNREAMSRNRDYERSRWFLSE